MYHLVLFTFCGRVISQLGLLLRDSGRKYGFSCQNIFFPFLHHGSRYSILPDIGCVLSHSSYLGSAELFGTF